MAESSPKPARYGRLFRYTGGGIVLFLVLGVWVSHQFPALTNGPKTSAELLAGLFKAPVEIPKDAAKYAIGRVQKKAVVGFVQLCDAPADVKGRVIQLVNGERFDEITAPFVFYLYELYAAPALANDDSMNDLAYAEDAGPAKDGGPGVGTLAQHPMAVRKHAGAALRLFDALFLQTKPGAGTDVPLPQRYDPAAYDQVKAVVRELSAEFLGPPSDAKDEQGDDYEMMFRETLADDEKLTEFIEFFTDLVRDLANSWLDSFVMREKRKETRLAWVDEKMWQNRYFEIADYSRRQAERRLAIHLAVDGLQGKLLEGLAQLSSGDRDSPGARYVIDLVRQHQRPEMDPSRYDSKLPKGHELPAGLGNDVVELAERAPKKSDYLENFKKYFFAADAPAIVVNVATVDTPSISVRNLPIIYSGHGVAGPHGTGIPNFSYLDRQTERGWYFWGSDVLHMRNIFANREGEDLIPHGRRRDGPGARTLMEHLWRHNTVCAMATIDNGALEKISSEVGIGIGEKRRNFIEKVLIQKFRERAEMERQLNDRRRWLVEHRNTSDSLLASLLTKTVTLATFRANARFIAEHEDEGLPDYLLWYNPWPDHFAHGEGPYSDAIIGYEGEYDRLDFYVGKMMQVYESVPTVSGPGATYADRALFGVVSDHGLVYTPHVVKADELLFEAMQRDGIDITELKITHDEGGLPAIHSRHRIKPTRPFDAVVGSTAGGSYIIDLFGTTATEGDNEAWRRHPDYHELRKLKLLSGQTIDFIEHLKRYLKDTMDLALVREYGPNAGEPWGGPGQFRIETVVRIVTPDRGEARIYRQRLLSSIVAAGKPVESPKPFYRYEILGDQDPLGLVDAVRDYLIPPGGQPAEQVKSQIRELIESQVGASDEQWRELLSYTIRPDVIYQFSHLYDSDRAGSVNVFPVSHIGMNSNVPGRHAGEAFGEKNGTQLYRGGGLKRTTIQTARNGSLAVTIYNWLVGDDAFSRSDANAGGIPADQFGYSSLLNEPAFAPIRLVSP